MLDILIQWIVPVVMVPVVARRHAPSAALAWILFIFFKPLPGLFLYLLIGENIVILETAAEFQLQGTGIRAKIYGIPGPPQTSSAKGKMQSVSSVPM